MKNVCKLICVILLSLCIAIGCATTKVTNQQQLVTGQLPKPNNIWVHDFVATPADIPADSALANQYSAPPTPQTAKQIAEGHKVGAKIAAELVAQIRALGMPAMQVTSQITPQINDIVIRGYLLSVDTGSADKRVAIGFSSGVSELKVAVEGFQMTNQGLRKIGSGTVDSDGNKTPGMAATAALTIATHNPLGLIVSTGMKVYGEESGSSTIEGRVKQTVKEISDQLKTRFQQEGWIQ
jgi:hypothetical protein